MSEKRLLQTAVALAGLVPVLAGALGALRPELLALAGPPHALTHAAYLSGLLMGLGLGFWSLIPSIERQGRVFGLLTGHCLPGRPGPGAGRGPAGRLGAFGGPATDHGTGRHARFVAVAAAGLFHFQTGMTIFRVGKPGKAQTWH